MAQLYLYVWKDIADVGSVSIAYIVAPNEEVARQKLKNAPHSIWGYDPEPHPRPNATNKAPDRVIPLTDEGYGEIYVAEF